MAKILIAEDQPAVATALQVLFEIRGLDCVVARNPAEALRLLETDAEAQTIGEPMGEDVLAERLKIERALAEAGGVVAKAANSLGLSRQALYRKMEKHGLVVERRVKG
jgi:DNA-binding NtrC family response regulator